MSEQDTQVRNNSSGSAQTSGEDADIAHRRKKTELTDDDRSFMKAVVERIGGTDISKFTDCWAEIGKILNQEENEWPLRYCMKQFRSISEYLNEHSDYSVPHAETFLQIYKNICQTVDENQKALAEECQPLLPSASSSRGTLPGRRVAPIDLPIPKPAHPILPSPRVLSGSSESAAFFPDTDRPEAQEHSTTLHDSSTDSNHTLERMEMSSDQLGRTLSLPAESLGEESMILGEFPADVPAGFARLTSAEGRALATPNRHGKTLSSREERLRKTRWSPEFSVDAPASSARQRSLQERHSALSRLHGKTLSAREARLWRQRRTPEHPTDDPASSTHLSSLEERALGELNQYDITFSTQEEDDMPGEYPVDVNVSSTSFESRLFAVLDRHSSTLDKLHQLLKKQETVLEGVGKQLEEIKTRTR